MSATSLYRTNTIISVAPQREFSLSSDEISAISRLWGELELVTFIGKRASLKGISNVVNEDELYKTKKVGNALGEDFFVPITEYNALNLRSFHLTICQSIASLEHKHREGSITDQLDEISHDYQILSIIQLMTAVIYFLNENNVIPSMLLKAWSKRNSRIWGFDNYKYSMFGESLATSILYTLQREKFSIEKEFLFIKFYTQLASYLSAYSADPLKESPPAQLPVHDPRKQRIVSNDTLSVTTSRLNSHGSFDRSTESLAERTTLESGDSDILNKYGSLNEDNESSETFNLFDSYNTQTDNNGRQPSKFKKYSLLSRINARNSMTFPSFGRKDNELYH